jgi:D-xylose transport system permease protein
MSETLAMSQPALPDDAGRPGLVRRVSTSMTNSRSLTVGITLVAVWLFFWVRDPNDVFLSARNLSNLTLQITVTGLLALGLVFVLLIGEIDLSVAALSGVSAAVVAALVQQNGHSTVVAVLIGLVFAASFQVVQSFVVVLGPPSFIVTLGASLVLNGLLLRLLPSTGQFNLSGSSLGKFASNYISTGWAVAAGVVLYAVFAAARVSTWHRQRGRGLSATTASLVLALAVPAVGAVVALTVFSRYRGVPVPFAVFFGLVLVASYALTQTRFGTSVYAVGGNREAARRAGIRVTAVVVTVFAIAGLLSALGGLIAASRVLGVSSQSGSGSLLLEAIAAAVIGGVSLTGGRGTAWASLLGALVIGSISNGMDLLDYSTSAKMMVQGGLLVTAVLVDVVLNRGSFRPSRGR